jgi:hypothetical protein
MQLLMGNANSHPQYPEEPEHDEEEADHDRPRYPQGDVRRGG